MTIPCNASVQLPLEYQYSSVNVFWREKWGASLRFQQWNLPYKATFTDLVDRKCESQGGCLQIEIKEPKTSQPNRQTRFEFWWTSEIHTLVWGEWRSPRWFSNCASHLRGDRRAGGAGKLKTFSPKLPIRVLPHYLFQIHGHLICYFTARKGLKSRTSKNNPQFHNSRAAHRVNSYIYICFQIIYVAQT